MIELLSKSSFDPADWNDWRWQMVNSIRTTEALSKWIVLTENERLAIEATEHKYRWRITPHYASLMNKNDVSCPIRRQAIPSGSEVLPFQDSDIDPVGDMFYRKTNRIIHKYPDRVVFLVTQTCPVYCRHCTRKFHTTDKEGSYFERGEGVSYEGDFEYIAKNPQIRDVLLTGGDPLTYADHKIEAIIKRLRSISHVDIIRIGSRYPVLLPQRITPELCQMLEMYHPVWFSTHFNHSAELTPEAVQACGLLLKHGIPVQNQTVLLKGINDSIDAMRDLMRALLRARVRPYYLYHCDNVAGVSHFMTSVREGRAIMAGLLGFISGYALPRYIITTSIGKIPLERSYVLEKDGEMVLENYRGETTILRTGIGGIPQPLLADTEVDDNDRDA